MSAGKGDTADPKTETSEALNRALVISAKSQFAIDSRKIAETDDPLEAAQQKVFEAKEALKAAEHAAQLIVNKRKPLMDTIAELSEFLSRNGERQYTLDVERQLRAQFKKQP